jgi:4-hydroxybenzoate decarboxylase subunit C
VGPLMRLIRPELTGLWAYYEAGFHNLLVASVKVRYRREAVKTGLALLSESQLALTKCVILVDSHVNPKDFNAVLAAIRRNFDAERKLTIIPRAPIDTLDFSSFRTHLGSKMIVDATSPVEEDTAPEEGEEREAPSSGSLGRLDSLDERISGWRLVGDTLLAVKVSSGGRELCERIVKLGLPPEVKMVAVLSEDIDLDDPVSLLWGIFTRFDPARDIVFAHSELRGAMPIYKGPMGIDATFKEGYPDPLEMPGEIVEKVNRRWPEYFDGRVDW